MPWDTEFYDPVILPDGRELMTFRDAADYITGLPKAEHDTEEWQSAVNAPDPRCGERRRLADAGPDGDAAGAEPERREGIQSRSQVDPLGQAEAEAG